MTTPAKPRAAFAAAAFAELRAAAGNGQGEVLRLLLADIDEDPEQPRTVFDDEGLAGLAASIREHGVVQPVVVRPPGPVLAAVGASRSDSTGPPYQWENPARLVTIRERCCQAPAALHNPVDKLGRAQRGVLHQVVR